MGNADSRPLSPEETSTSIARPKDKNQGGGGGGGNATAPNTDDDDSSEKRQDRTRRNKGGDNHRESRVTANNNINTNKSADEKINVNMAMADLMAYLQVVANNSNNLPLTLRDDPELDQVVSTLTPEDYARKSAAFVPADVRIIGGTFTRYGRVWDLPTTQEYNACDGAHEPGRSYGGACCNTMLKVIYDAANDVEGAAQTEAAAQALFEDDDEETDDDDAPSFSAKSIRSGDSIDFTSQMLIQSNLTWASLLRQMKPEFKDVGYAQVPKITTTRKFDLNEPFSLTSDKFDPKKNKKRALLIGCNYKVLPGAELKASHDDVRSIKDFIVNVHGFSEKPEYMTVLLDEDNHTPPTYHNIIESFKQLSEQAQPGDAVFVQFSGHGGRVLDAVVDAQAESYDEIIVPMDYEDHGVIRDTLIFKTLLAPMRYGVTLTVMIDCCDTGMVLELPYSWTTRGDKKDSIAKLTMNTDFSFVRFLKVVKTLYESSTFTQLGKTVGSALNPLESPTYGNKNVGDESRKSGRGSGRKGSRSPSSDSIFDALAEACNHTSPSARETKNNTNSNGNNHHVDDQSTIARKDTLFEQVIKGCTLLSNPAHDEFSDEDTFKTPTEEEDLSYCSDEGGSYETMDDEYSSPRNTVPTAAMSSRARSKRRQQRH